MTKPMMFKVLLITWVMVVMSVIDQHDDGGDGDGDGDRDVSGVGGFDAVDDRDYDDGDDDDGGVSRGSPGQGTLSPDLLRVPKITRS